jgi:hypothetical protein
MQTLLHELLLPDLTMIVKQYCDLVLPLTSTIPREFETHVHDYMGCDMFGTELIMSAFSKEPFTEHIPFFDRFRKASSTMHSNYDIMSSLIGRLGITFQVPNGDTENVFVIISVNPSSAIVGVVFPRFRYRDYILDLDLDLTKRHLCTCTLANHKLELEKIEMKQFIKCSDRIFTTELPVFYISLKLPQECEWHVYYPHNKSNDNNADDLNTMCDLNDVCFSGNKAEGDFLSSSFLVAANNQFWNSIL